MMHPGKPDRVRAPIIGFLAMIGIVLLLENGWACPANGSKGRGHRRVQGIAMGTSIEQSMKIYQDLYFEKYVISDSKEERGEYMSAGWSTGNRGCRVRFHRILVQGRSFLSGQGGVTFQNRSQNDGDKGRKRIRQDERQVEETGTGTRPAHKVDYVTEFIVVVREATWNVDPSAITINTRVSGAQTRICSP